jgi:hypothetical protein
MRVPHISRVFREMWEERGPSLAIPRQRRKLDTFGGEVVRFPTSRQKQARYGAPAFVAKQGRINGFMSDALHEDLCAAIRCGLTPRLDPSRHRLDSSSRARAATTPSHQSGFSGKPGRAGPDGVITLQIRNRNALMRRRLFLSVPRYSTPESGGWSGPPSEVFSTGCNRGGLPDVRSWVYAGSRLK